MTQQEIIKHWSDRILDRLLEYRQAHPGFTFALRKQNRYGRLEAGHWFQGNEDYIFVGFSNRNDEDNKTNSLGLVFYELGTNSSKCYIEVVFRSEPLPELVSMYRHLVTWIPGFYSPNQPYYEGYKYRKDYPTGDLIQNLDKFLAKDWKLIQKKVDLLGLAADFFVPEELFLLSLSRIEALRGNPQPTAQYATAIITKVVQEERPPYQQVTEEEIEQVDESSSHGANGDIIDPFDASKIDIRDQAISLDLLVKRIRQGRINLYPEYQRLPELWKPDRMSQLIESLLIRIPLPVFYFDGSNDAWEVVDGLQRLSTLKRFMVDKGDEALRLTGLEYLKQYNGKTFEELPLFLQSRIEETQLMIYIINPGTPEEIKFNIFKRINTGGLMLTPQEIRNALNQGIPSKTIREMATYPEFKLATQDKVPTQRMEDCDFVARFVGFYHGYREYSPDLDSWLNKGMARLKTMSEIEIGQMKANFKKAMLAMHDIFGDEAFRKRYESAEDNPRRKPINKALFDAWSVNMAKLSNEEIYKLVRRKKRLSEGFIKLMNTAEFDDAVSRSTGDGQSVRRRFEFLADLIQRTLEN